MSATESNLVLIVDDLDSARYHKMRTLQRAGFDVLEAKNGAEALTVIAHSRPRLVVLDTHLPEVDGWEVCRRIKADPHTASVLVLQVSATYVREEDTVRALEGGADACLTEPVEGPVLIATVRALLRARSAEDALRDALAREQAARAAAEAANRIKDEFLATLSHELRSPIGAVLTWVTLLRTGHVDETRTKHALEAIERNTRIQVQLIEDLLDVSRIISGKMRLEMAPIDLGAIVASAIEAVRPAAQRKGVHVVAPPLASLPLLSADAARLHQVVWNLLSNAIKFTPKNGQVDISLEHVASQIEIRVHDTGRGIEAAFLPHIFERFRQADSSSTRVEGGLGLGLAIVRHLIEMHGGTVSAESPGVGQGATFTVRLPMPAVLLPPPTSGGPLVPALSHAHWQQLDRLRVLVVDDQRDAREAVAAVLEQYGASLTLAAGVDEGLEAVTSGAIDVVISDIGMPVLDGYELIRRIRSNPEPQLARLPSLALTAYGGLEDERRVFVAGFDAYLPKPVDAQQLVGAVARLAARRTT
jgi:signal transduction histidine kinase